MLYGLLSHQLLAASPTLAWRFLHRRPSSGIGLSGGRRQTPTPIGCVEISCQLSLGRCGNDGTPWCCHDAVPAVAAARTIVGDRNGLAPAIFPSTSPRLRCWSLFFSLQLYWTVPVESSRATSVGWQPAIAALLECRCVRSTFLVQATATSIT